MGTRRLDTADWGFPTNCFVCGPANPRGLQVPFFHDEDGDLVVAEFSFGEEFSGAPRYVHGGLVLALLDEAMAWAAIALVGRFAVSREHSATFHHPVRLGRPYRVEGRAVEHDASTVTARAEILDGKDRCCARAQGGLVVLSAAMARWAIGDLPQEAARYLRPSPAPEG